MTMAVMAAERVDYFQARANCQVRFPAQKGRSVAEAPGELLEVSFPKAARGCATDEAFDPDRNRQVYRLSSLLTFFHADDERPAWVRSIQTLTRGATPPELPGPLRGLAGRILREYGAGSITVIQDENRPVVGEVVAGEPGPDGAMFPAYSYFDQYLVVKVAGRTFTNRKPLRVSATVSAWPPGGETYHSEAATPFFDVNEPDAPAAFEFGNCTISILTPLASKDRASIEDAIATLRG